MTADINEFSPPRDAGVAGKFDRVISIEMFEHLHNYKLALARLASWLRSEGKAFLHVFCHRSAAYPFESEGSANWMGRRFFSGGIMPSADLIPSFDDDLQVVERWHWNGEHYRRTAEAWLANLDARRRKALSVLAGAYGRRAAGVRLQCWRMFFLAVAELFGFDAGREWFVSHYLLEPIRQSANG